MAYELRPDAPIGTEIRRVVAEQLGAALSALSSTADAEPAEIERAVHNARKRAKEVRAAARMVRGSIGDRAFRRFNTTVAGAADQLAPIRDAHALAGAFDALIETAGDVPAATAEALARVRAGQAELAARASASVCGGDPRVAAAIEQLTVARSQVEGWKIADRVRTLTDGLTTTMRRGERAMRAAAGTADDHLVHEWRKTAKHLWYQARLVRLASPVTLDPLIVLLDRLSEALGHDHDLAVLVAQIEAEPRRFGGIRRVRTVASIARAAQAELRPPTFRIGETLYAEGARAFAERVGAYWRLARDRGDEPSVKDLA